MKVNTDIQPVPEGKESWKSQNTYNGVEIVKGVGMTKDVIVPDVVDMSELKEDTLEYPPKEQKYDGVLTVDSLNKSLKGMNKVITQEEYNEINTPKPSINDLFDTDKDNNEKSN